MNIKHILYTVVAAFMTATPALAGNTMDDHETLWNTLQSAGVTVMTNATDCDDDAFGYYNRREVKVVVCQDTVTLVDVRSHGLTTT